MWSHAANFLTNIYFQNSIWHKFEKNFVRFGLDFFFIYLFNFFSLSWVDFYDIFEHESGKFNLYRALMVTKRKFSS